MLEFVTQHVPHVILVGAGSMHCQVLLRYMRKLCGLPTYSQLYVPFYIFDKSNAANAGTPADYDRGYGDQHVAGYNKLWELK